MRALAWAGRHASALLLCGFFLSPFLPVSAEALRPALPPLVALVTGLGVARQRFDGQAAAALVAPRAAGGALLWFAAVQVGAAWAATALGAWAGLEGWQLLCLAAFFAAPPLSSAPNLSHMLGYDSGLALRLTLTGTALAPALMPLALSAAGQAVESGAAQIGLRVLGMLAAGIGLGLALRLGLGEARIARRSAEFNGLAALAMIAFLFPLMGGALEAVQDRPALAVGLLGAAAALNMGGNLIARRIAAAAAPAASARALGLVFGNRNTALALAALPYDPMLTLFVAAMQFPIYAGPFLFSRFESRLSPCPDSSAS